MSGGVTPTTERDSRESDRGAPSREARSRPFRIGLTGGIASGKSTVARLFEALGIPVIDADELAREVVAPDTPLLAELVQRFGRGILQTDGTLHRKALRDIIFADENKRREVESLMHPAIREAMQARSERSRGAYQIFMIPLLIEQRGVDVDRILVVDCDEAAQIRRLQARDGSTIEQARA
jgi:dephospho-CoA kinase